MFAYFLNRWFSCWRVLVRLLTHSLTNSLSSTPLSHVCGGDSAVPTSLPPRPPCPICCRETRLAVSFRSLTEIAVAHVSSIPDTLLPGEKYNVSRFWRIIASSNNQIHIFSDLVVRKREEREPLIDKFCTKWLHHSTHLEGAYLGYNAENKAQGVVCMARVNLTKN